MDFCLRNELQLVHRLEVVHRAHNQAVKDQALVVVDSVNFVAQGEISWDLSNRSSHTTDSNHTVPHVRGPTTAYANVCTHVSFAEEGNVVERCGIVVRTSVERVRR